MEARVRAIGDVSVVDLRGIVTIGEGGVVLKERVDELLEQDQPYILLNLAQVPYIDSCGLGALVSCYLRACENGATMKLLSPSAKVYELLELTKLDDVFETFHDEKEALVSFSSGQRDVCDVRSQPGAHEVVDNRGSRG